ncbi:class I SAM-dependent methyltransferase [Micromonospora sp. WMMD980]|uniref:class I SAM-dependent methyltransferase n=1 Tax=Micromonospora sp. WMMD980 TaxID=3016088 RepID=UPI002416153C|nr:class I SAM-dependent methyltransferase [Micromonospora sp. WMMD980]MDG4801826.1 class I SAM-dependent methyltransferase [Micromonospora sp. WMMD980]
MGRPSVLDRVRARVPGMPRSGREVLTSLQVLSTLRAKGWHRSVSGGAPSGPDGAPRPWLTYAAMNWLATYVGSRHRVFEYGAGSSTRWFADALRVREIVAVEHDADWARRLRQRGDGQVLHVPCDGTWWDADEDAPYVRAVEAGRPWDVIIIDGMARTTCARLAPRHLTPAGLVVLDDTDRPTTRPADQSLTDQGFGRLDFWGFKPGLGIDACTTIFSRDFNSWMVPTASGTDDVR